MKKIKQSYTRRLIYKICQDTKEDMLSDSAEVLNPAELISTLEKKVLDISIATTASNTAYKMGTDTEKVLEERGKHP